MVTKELISLCSNIEDWPQIWEIDPRDPIIGGKILMAVFVPFFESLIEAKLSSKTIKKHINNTWLLGGEIIERVNSDEVLRGKTGSDLVLMYVDEFGGPYSRHLNTEEEVKSFDSSCKKLRKFINSEREENTA